MGDMKNTQFFKTVQDDTKLEVSQVLEQVYFALTEKGYNPINQIVGYIMSVYSADIRKAAQAENAKAESDIQKQGVGIAPACFIVGKYPQSAGAHTVPVNGGFMESQ